MSTDFGEVTEVLKPIKDHVCVWCPEPIKKGEAHHKYVGLHNGDFQDWRVHKECLTPATDSSDADPDGYFCEQRHSKGGPCGH